VIRWVVAARPGYVCVSMARNKLSPSGSTYCGWCAREPAHRLINAIIAGR
jgi:hypothetical protein